MKLSFGAIVSLLLMFAGILFLGFGLTAFLGDDYITLAVGIDILFITIFIVTIFIERKQKFCTKCKKQYDFQEDIAYNTKKKHTKKFRIDPRNQNRQVVEKLYHTITFNCTCAKCGRSKRFTKTFNGGCAYSDGTVEFEDCRDIIEDYFSSPGYSYNDGKSIKFGIVFGIISIIVSIFLMNPGLLPLDQLGFGTTYEENYLEPDAFIGTYYGISSDYVEYTLTIESDYCKISSKPLTGIASEDTYTDEDYKFWTSDYISSRTDVTGHEGENALVIEKSKIFWIEATTNGDVSFIAKLTDGEILKLTKDPIDIRSISGDPQDYYGTYVCINENDMIRLVIDENNLSLANDTEEDIRTYIYMNKSMLECIGFPEYESGLLIERNGSYSAFFLVGENIEASGSLFIKQ